MNNKWKFSEENIKKMYKEKDVNLDMSYEEFKALAELYADSLIEKVKKEIKNEKVT